MKDKDITTLIVTIDKKQYVQIGDDITIDCNQSNSRHEARLVIKAPREVKITRIKRKGDLRGSLIVIKKTDE